MTPASSPAPANHDAVRSTPVKVSRRTGFESHGYQCVRVCVGHALPPRGGTPPFYVIISPALPPLERPQSQHPSTQFVLPLRSVRSRYGLSAELNHPPSNIRRKRPAFGARARLRTGVMLLFSVSHSSALWMKLTMVGKREGHAPSLNHGRTTTLEPGPLGAVPQGRVSPLFPHYPCRHNLVPHSQREGRCS